MNYSNIAVVCAEKLEIHKKNNLWLEIQQEKKNCWKEKLVEKKAK